LERTCFVIELLLLLSWLTGGAAGCTRQRQTNGTLIRHARVFDGERMLPGLQTVVIANGLIRSVSPDAPSDGGGECDAGGRVLVPGLFDSHMHAGDGVRVLQQQLVFGVTRHSGCTTIRTSRVSCASKRTTDRHSSLRGWARRCRADTAALAEAAHK